MANMQSSGMIKEMSPPWYCPNCGFGPHNPHIDVGCANCGHIPNRKSARVEQTMTCPDNESLLPICSMAPMAPMAPMTPTDTLAMEPFGPLSNLEYCQLFSTSEPSPSSKSFLFNFYDASKTEHVSTTNFQHPY